jgi:hypothetical protein
MRKILTLAVSVLIASSALAGGDIYRWKDDNGTWHYSDQPHPGAQLVRRGDRAVNTDVASTTATPPASSPTAETSGSLPVSDAVAAEVRQEAATAKSEQCKKAEEVYQKSVQARRITKKDEKGNTVYLSDAEIDAARLQARSVRDVACGPGA